MIFDFLKIYRFFVFYEVFLIVDEKKVENMDGCVGFYVVLWNCYSCFVKNFVK